MMADVPFWDDMVANASPDGWRQEMQPSPQKPAANLSNLLLILSNDVNLRGVIAWNDFAYSYTTMRAPPPLIAGHADACGPYPRPMQGQDITAIQAYVQRVYIPQLNQDVTRQAVEAIAHETLYHPVRAWLKSLTWDGKPRLDQWLQTVFGADDTPYTRACGATFLIAAVRRALQPGCKFDSMLVIEGAQDIGKSTAMAELFNREWFSDRLEGDLGNRDAAIGLQGKWAVEVAEMHAIVKTDAKLTEVKAFITRQVDHYRPMHARDFIDRPRQGVLCGTTNQKEWLTDPTGNRRFWIVPATKAETGWLVDWRDQLWAEAVQAETTHGWLHLSNADLKTAAALMQESRMVEDAWAEAVLAYAVEHGPVPTTRLLHDCLGLPRMHQTRAAMLRVVDIMRGHGWVQKSVRIDGGTPRRAWHHEKGARSV